MKLLRTTAGISLTLVAGLVLAGCSSTPDETTAPVAEGDVSTDFRKPQNQKPVDPNAGGYVDAGDTSRQDGPKEIKYISEDVERINPNTGDEETYDATTILKVEVNSITKGSSGTPAKAYQLQQDDDGKLVPTEVTLENADTYAIDFTVEYVSGYDGLSSRGSIPLFYPITSSGAATAVSVTGDSGATKTKLNLSYTAVTAAGDPAPVGVRYTQYDENFEDLLTPTIDIFQLDKATAKPKTDETTK